MSEFYDLSERLLNSGDSYWGNLGYWKKGSDYSQACENLAKHLAIAVNLNSDSRVLDAGFGCGDQLLLWLTEYRIQFLSGINYSISQTELAQQRLLQSGHTNAAENIHQGSVSELHNSTLIEGNRVNSILALDCAYHFPSRNKFFYDSFNVLSRDASKEPEGTLKGRIGLTDIVLASSQVSWGKRLILNVMLAASRIPKENIITLVEYKNQLKQAGFSDIVEEDISESVFEPFGHWLKLQKGNARYQSGSRSALLKYKVTAAFLAWAHKNEVLKYIVISAKIR